MSLKENMVKYLVDRELIGVRLDRSIRIITGVNLNQTIIEISLKKGLIKVNSKKIKSNYRLFEGDEISYSPIIFNSYNELKPNIIDKNSNLYKSFLARIKNSIIAVEEDFLVLNKPQNTAVQTGSRIKIAISDILDDLKIDPKDDLKIIHRLDLDTTGILLIARSRRAAEELSYLLSQNNIKKVYISLNIGHYTGKLPLIIDKDIEVDGNFKYSETILIDAENFMHDNIELSKMKWILKTGRKHQIRIHASSINMPILGDGKYGDFRTNRYLQQERIILHALEVSFKLYGVDYYFKSNFNY